MCFVVVANKELVVANKEPLISNAGNISMRNFASIGAPRENINLVYMHCPHIAYQGF